jgi:ferredoxin
MSSLRSELIPYLERTAELTVAQKRVLSEWQRASEVGVILDPKTFASRCVQCRTVPLLVLDHVLKWMEGDKSRMGFLEFKVHLVCSFLSACVIVCIVNALRRKCI